MSNRKLWLASLDGMSRSQPGERKKANPGCSDELPHSLRPDEGYRLIRAFSRIPDPAMRARLIDFVEKHGRN